MGVYLIEHGFHFVSGAHGEVYVGTEPAARLHPQDLPAGTTVTNEWQMFTYTFKVSGGSGTNRYGYACFYKNGVLLASKNDMGAPVEWIEDGSRGTGTGGPYQFQLSWYMHGGVDDCRLYNYVLTADEVEALYDSAFDGASTTTSSDTTVSTTTTTIVSPYATGGSAYEAGGYWVHVFTTNDTFTPNAGMDVEYLIVAGGGGGGGGLEGGGGGAGGMLTGTVAVPAGACPVVVGDGGAGSFATAGTPAVNGSPSSFNPGTLIEALGGGRGYSQTPDIAASTGGSGGGGANTTTKSGADGEPGQGNRGGDGTLQSNYGTGGGGGAGGAGTDGTTTDGGVGGVGLASSITGSSVTYARGGYGNVRAGGTKGSVGAANTGNNVTDW